MPTEKKPKKPKVVLDTNVIVSGLNFSGKERKILDLIWEGEIELYISRQVWDKLQQFFTLTAVPFLD
jgi:predicted nucleic acid-binding protein